MKNDRSSKSRILDIALQAGVSTATVDRVVNGRSGVRHQTKAKVLNAIRMLDVVQSRPRVIPSLNDAFKIDVVIAGDAGFANELLARELRQAGRDRGIKLRSAHPHRLNPNALAEALETCLQRGTSGIIVQALDHPVVRSVIETINNAGVPVVSLLTGLPGSKTLGYVGLDNRAAGRTAGLLMGLLVKDPGRIALFVGGSLYRSHEEREIGFRTVLRENSPHLSMMPAFQTKDAPERSLSMATELIATTDNLRGILNIGSGNRGIEKALLDSGRANDIAYVCFNLTPLTRQALLSGVVDAVVHQDMRATARIAIATIVDQLTSRKPVFPQVPVEIIMRENVR